MAGKKFYKGISCNMLTLSEKGIKQIKQSTESSKNVETEREKETKKEIKTETGGEKHSPTRFKDIDMFR